jgi:hypothetical protein
LGELVELSLVHAPVVRRSPVLGQILYVVQRDPAVPADARHLARPPSAVQPVGQVIEVGLGNFDPETPDLGLIGHGNLLVC